MSDQVMRITTKWGEPNLRQITEEQNREDFASAAKGSIRENVAENVPAQAGPGSGKPSVR